MAARDSLNHEQLKMFMSPREIGASVKAYGDFGPNMGGLPHEQPKGPNWKIRNSQESGMYDSIAKDGVKHPVALGHTPRGLEFINGHHRLSVQSSVDPDRLMPVSHWDEREKPSMAMFDGDVVQQRDPTGDRKNVKKSPW
jgi:hypothetical protein